MVDPRNFDTVAIVSRDHMAAVVAAAPLRRAGIPVEVFLTGSRKRQWDKAGRFEVVVDLDERTAKDMILGGKIDLGGDIVGAALAALDGIEVDSHA